MGKTNKAMKVKNMHKTNKAMKVYAFHEPRSLRVKLVARKGTTGFGPIFATLSAVPSSPGWRYLVDQFLAYLRSEHEVYIDPSLVDLLEVA